MARNQGPLDRQKSVVAESAEVGLGAFNRGLDPKASLSILWKNRPLGLASRAQCVESGILGR